MSDCREVWCPVTERIQPKLVQLGTSCYDLHEAARQADILAESIRFFS